MTRRVSPAEQGRLQGANFGVQSIAQFLGPGLFSLTYVLLEGGRAPLLPGGSILIAGGVQFLAAALAAVMAGGGADPRAEGVSAASSGAPRAAPIPPPGRSSPVRSPLQATRIRRS
jgi:hypothetical protein